MPLICLPNELLFLIADNLFVPDLNSFLQTNKHLANMLTPHLHQVAVADLDGCPALLWALRTANEPLVRLLLEKGVDANSQKDGVTALLYAVIRLREPIIRMLLENGTDMHVAAIDRDGKSPLHDAVIRLGELIVRLLLGNSDGSAVCSMVRL
ncbi:hypothetical protein Q9L58_006348 [Maublancomyces gigas]|uniref:Ankyrin n=1 Tax=Discina gigas TaxID=1032678 RepID=A0ABR3GFH9_9PEZI